MKEFNVGDRVIVRSPIGWARVKDVHGIVAAIDLGLYGVVLDKHIDGCHTLSTHNFPDGFCPDGYGWWLREGDLEVEPSDNGTSDTVSVDEEAFSYA